MPGSRLLVLFLIPALFVSCSSAPEPSDEILEKKNRAAENTEFGNTYFNQANYTMALNFFTLALNDNISVDNERGIIQSYNSIGKVCMALSELPSAERNFSRALALAYKTGDAPLIAQSANNLGEVYLIRNEIDKSMGLIQEAMNQIDAQNPGSDGAIIFHNMGCIYKKKEKFDEALNFFQNALEVNLKLKRFEEAASNYYMISSVHSKRGDYTKALDYAGRALDLDKQVENSLGIAKDLLALGIISSKAGRYEEACNYFKRSYQVYETLSLTRECRKIIPFIITACEITGKTEEADRYRLLFEETRVQ